ncbi:MAG: hypothetical protein J5I98_26260 [Phaeodactylibacter sp.]|nr:hypothetical protein [Phaeodactylibacter sp.]
MKNNTVYLLLARYFFLPALILFSFHTLPAQAGKLPENRFQDKDTWGEAIRNANERTGGISLGYGYHRSQFLNPRFSTVSESGNLKPAYGDYVNLRLTAAPFVFDVSWFASRYKVDNYPDWPYADSVKVRHRGWEFAASFIPIQNGVFSKYVVPYLGVGYQSASVCTGCGWDYALELKSSVDASMPIWKVGAMINISPLFFVNAEYKQSLGLSQKNAFSQWSVGIANRFNYYYLR